jgi:hypothetical protein
MFLLMLTAFFFVAGIGLDLARAHLAGEAAQQAADLASLSGAGTAELWEKIRVEREKKVCAYCCWYESCGQGCVVKVCDYNCDKCGCDWVSISDATVEGKVQELYADDGWGPNGWRTLAGIDRNPACPGGVRAAGTKVLDRWADFRTHGWSIPSGTDAAVNRNLMPPKGRGRVVDSFAHKTASWLNQGEEFYPSVRVGVVAFVKPLLLDLLGIDVLTVRRCGQSAPEYQDETGRWVRPGDACARPPEEVYP